MKREYIFIMVLSFCLCSAGAKDFYPFSFNMGYSKIYTGLADNYRLQLDAGYKIRRFEPFLWYSYAYVYIIDMHTGGAGVRYHFFSVRPKVNRWIDPYLSLKAGAVLHRIMPMREFPGNGRSSSRFVYNAGAGCIAYLLPWAGVFGEFGLDGHSIRRSPFNNTYFYFGLNIRF
ncbi:MAG: hypothetical protein LBG15_09700 [Dysgonamonadaceae bacterium]|jgi:hypothetical protein|nr:hypothetical protein [Dysgonamonadaceae bacterium]